MSLTDPVADMLTRIRNACSAGHRRVDMPVSKLKTEVARLLQPPATPASAVDHASAVTDSSQSARSRAATKPI